MEILVRKTRNWGNDVVYPECRKAKIFAKIAGTTTLTSRAIEQIKSLGYVINVKPETI